MTIIHGGLSRASFRYPNLDIEKIKIIAWGAGQFFRDLYPITGIKAEYTICPRSENQGTVIHGIEVKSPEFLRNEDPANILILIFSAASLEITHQIGSWGNFRALPAVEYGSGNNHIIDELLLLQKNIHSIPPKKEYFSETGFFTQGPIFPFTELALAYHRLQFPNDYHCFVTDAGQSQEAVQKCARWVDEVIEVSLPKTPGPLRRNYMIRTAKAGADHIQKKGFKYCVRVRSGNITIGNVRKYIYKIFGEDGIYHPGKIGFYMGWSWKNVPFHISEAFMVARSEDMAALWNIDEDPRQENDPIINVSQDEHHTELARSSNESYVWSNFAKNLNLPNSSIEDHLNFMRSKLIPLEPDLRTYSLKYIPIFSLDYENHLSPDRKWWDKLITDFDYTRHKAQEISRRNTNVNDHFSNKIG